MESLLIFIVLGIISFVFNLSKEKNPEKKRTFPGIPKELQDTYKEIMRGGMSNPATGTPPARQTMGRQAYDLKKQAEDISIAQREKIITQQTISKQKRVPVSVEHSEIGSQNDLENAGISLSQKNLLDAVIWTEILGPPRSKKPHRS